MAIPFTSPQPIAYLARVDSEVPRTTSGTSLNCSFLGSTLRDSDFERSLEIWVSANPRGDSDVGVPKVHLGKHWPNEPEPLLDPSTQRTCATHLLCEGPRKDTPESPSSWPLQPPSRDHTSGGPCCYSHFTAEETEAQRGHFDRGHKTSK